MFIVDTVRTLAATDRVAAVKEGIALTFRELEFRSNALAAYLLETHPGHTPIILWGDKEHDMLCAILAALKIGRPYVVIPDYYPPLRVKLILNSCCPDVILNIGAASFPVEHACIYTASDINSIVSAYAGRCADPSFTVAAQDLVCIFYTSGSTGSPKGVCVSRENIEAFTQWWHGYCDGGIAAPRMMNIASYAFADSVMTIYTLMGSMGATLYAADHAMQQDYKTLLQYILQVDPHYMDCTPSFANLCLKDPRFSSQGLPSMYMLSLGGETLNASIAETLLDRFPRVKVVNAYGATETTIGSTACVITREMIRADQPVSIGTASYNSKVYVVDESGNQLPDGRIGELIIASDMIAMGYYKDPQRTAQAFFTDENALRAFHTHDLAWKQNDHFYCIGRMDNVVKVGGYRVDLGEVEQYLAKADPVQECAVVPVKDGGQVILTCAYIVLKPNYTKGLRTTAAIKTQLRQWLQDYMIPQKLLYLDALVYTATGKIDRQRLCAMAQPGKEMV